MTISNPSTSINSQLANLLELGLPMVPKKNKYSNKSSINIDILTSFLDRWEALIRIIHVMPPYPPRLVSSFYIPASILSFLPSPFMGLSSVIFRSVEFQWYALATNNLPKLLLVWTRERVPLKVCGLTSYIYPIPPRRPSESKSCMMEVGG